MALDLGLSYSQSNAAVTVTLTDTAGTYVVTDNGGGWGTPNPEVTDIVASTVTTAAKYHLKLDITVVDKSGVSTTYDTIDLYDHNNGAFTDASDLVFNILAVDLFNSGTAMGDSGDKLTDGIYTLSYKLVDAATDLVETSSIEQEILLDGDVRLDVYNKLRQVPKDYDNENNDKSYDIMEALLSYSYLLGTNAGSDTSQVEELYTQLYTLDKLVSDGSNYTW